MAMYGAANPDEIRMGDRYREANAGLATGARQAFPNATSALQSSGDASDRAAASGNYAGALGNVPRGAVKTIAGVGKDMYDATAKYILDPAASMLKTAVTGDTTPERAPRFSDALTPTQRGVGSAQPRATQTPFDQAARQFMADERAPARPTTALAAAQRQFVLDNQRSPTYADDVRAAWQRDPSASRGLRGANGAALDMYNHEQDARGSGISAVRQANGTMAFSNAPGGTGDTGGAVSSGGDMAAANAAYARANAIRAGNGALQDQINFNAGQGASRQMSQDEIIRNMLTSNSRSDRQAALQYLNSLDTTKAQQSGAMDRARMENQLGYDTLAANKDVRGAQAGLYRSQTGLADAQSDVARHGLDMQSRARPEFDKVLLKAATDSGDTKLLNEHVATITAQQAAYDGASARIALALKRGYTPEQIMQHPKLGPEFALLYGAPRVKGYAEGGEVQPYGAAPQMTQALPLINDYRDYASGAQRLGLPPVSFEHFAALRNGAQNPAPATGAQPYSAMGFAQGGEIPDMMSGMHDAQSAGGKMMVDTNPQAPTDSIPAVIDGQHPAKLDSGEFVLPQDVVKFYGTDKLNKMIAQARAEKKSQE